MKAGRLTTKHKGMKQVGKVVGAVVLAALAGGVAQAQERATNGTNPLSVREINDTDIMMKKTIWRRVDLKEKQNRSMYSKNNEITRYLIDAVKAGLLVAYESDSVNRPMDAVKFKQKLIMPNQAGGLSEEEIKAGFSEEGTPKNANDGWGEPAAKKPAPKKPATDDGWGTPSPKKSQAAADDGWGTPAPKKSSKTATAKNTKGKKPAAKPAPVLEEKPAVDSAAMAAISGDEFFPQDLSILELKEDWIFDRKRSRQYYDIQTVGLILPSDKNPAGLEIPVAYFKYKDLEKLFRSDPKKFIWYNPQNQAQHLNLADAFDLRLFYGRIWKYSNAEDKDLITLYGSEREGLMKSYQTEQELLEAEHGLWEY